MEYNLHPKVRDQNANRVVLLVLILGVSATFDGLAPAVAYAASQSDAEPQDAFLTQLKSPEPDVRIAALRELQTSLDPRIPDAMLPLLADEGNSIRRLAARAIGSRWWQIPKKSDMFAASSNGRWIVYERRALPCLI